MYNCKDAASVQRMAGKRSPLQGFEPAKINFIPLIYAVLLKLPEHDESLVFVYTLSCKHKNIKPNIQAIGFISKERKYTTVYPK